MEKDDMNSCEMGWIFDSGKVNLQCSDVFYDIYINGLSLII